MLDTDARHRDLLFLLGLAPLALGCSVGVPDDGPTFTSTPPSTPPGDGSSAEDDTGDGEGEGEGTTGSAEDGMSASVSVSVSVSAGDDGTTSGASASASMSASVSVSMGDEMGTYTYTSSYGPPPPYGSSCEAYGYLIASCYYNGDPMMAAMVASNCEEGLSFYGMTYGPACGMAYEDMVACLSQLSCQEFQAVGMPGGPCGAEDAAFGQACS